MTSWLSIMSVIAMAAIACLGLPRAAQVIPPDDGVGALETWPKSMVRWRCDV